MRGAHRSRRKMSRWNFPLRVENRRIATPNSLGFDESMLGWAIDIGLYMTNRGRT